jgi:hypothetical protein
MIMQQVPVSKKVEQSVYSLRNCFVCSYLKALEMKDAIMKQDEQIRPMLRMNKAVPEDTIYYIDSLGTATKYILTKESENE